MSDGYSFVWLSGRNPYVAAHDGAVVLCVVSFGVPYIDTEDPRRKPRPATVLGKGSYVKVAHREGKHGKPMVIVRGHWCSEREGSASQSRSRQLGGGTSPR